MVVFCNAEEGKMERGHTSIAFPHVSTDAAFCEKIQKKKFLSKSQTIELRNESSQEKMCLKIS